MTPFAHPVLLYRGERDYLAGTVPFVYAGLALGEAVAVAVPEPNLELIRSALGADATDVQLIDMRVAGRNPGWILPGVLLAFADAHPGRRVRVISEPIWPGRSATEYPACLQHEALINLAFAGRRATILCPYDADGLAPEILADAEVTHPILLDAAGRHASEAYAPERVIGGGSRLLRAPSGAATLVFGPAKVLEARRFAAVHADRLGLAAERATDLMLAVNELATNSVLHGGGVGTLRLWVADGHLVCEVSDAGRLADPLVGRLPAPEDAIGGRGVLLVNYVADLVLIDRAGDGTTVQLHLEL